MDSGKRVGTVKLAPRKERPELYRVPAFFTALRLRPSPERELRAEVNSRPIQARLTTQRAGRRATL